MGKLGLSSVKWAGLGEICALVVLVALVLLLALVPVMALIPIPRILPTGMLVAVTLDDPLLLNKIHRLSASVIAAAMLTPLLLMPRWNIQVNRLAHHGHWLLHDDHRLLIDDDGRWAVADVNSSINTGLVDTDRYAYRSLC